VEVPLTIAWIDAPVLGWYPVHCHCLNENLRPHSHAHSISLILKGFGLDPECFRLQVLVSEGSRFARVVAEMAGAG
jgi:hypothetical protein